MCYLAYFFNVLNLIIFMKKILKKWWFWLIIVIVLVVILNIFLSSSKESVVYTTEAANIQDLKQTVEVTGKVESADDIDLNFLGSGTLRDINVKVGDQVKTGQILASLSAGDVAAQVNNARAALDVAKSDLASILAGASAADLNVTEQEVNNALTAYQAALDNLASLEKTRDDDMASLRTAGLNTLNDKLFVARYSLDLVYDAILDSDADYSLYVNDTNLLTTAKYQYEAAQAKYTEVAVLVAKAQSSNQQADILSGLDQLRQLLQATSETLNNTFNVMNTVVINSVYTQTVVDTFKTSLSSNNTSVNTAMSAVASSASNLRAKDLYYQNAILQQTNAVKVAQDTLDLAKARLDLKKAPARDFQIEAARARVRQAEANLSRALSDLSDKSIKAPVDGLITKVNYAKGEQTSAAKAVISMIGLSTLQIEVDVPESDITKLKINDEVDIDINAFTDGSKFKGTVTFIDPAATVINEVIYYKVNISFKEKDDRIKSGMTADLTVLTASKPQVLVVPSRAVINRDDQHYVQVLVDKQPVDKEVEVGLKGDNSLIEIVSGLSAGEEVIVSAKTNGKKK